MCDLRVLQYLKFQRAGLLGWWWWCIKEESAHSCGVNPLQAAVGG